MKQALSYYLFLERPIVLIVATIYFLALVIIFALVTNSLYEIGNSVHEYFTIGKNQKQLCESMAKNNPNYYWKDETVLGFGPDGSFGCFLADPKIDTDVGGEKEK